MLVVDRWSLYKAGLTVPTCYLHPLPLPCWLCGQAGRRKGMSYGTLPRRRRWPPRWLTRGWGLARSLSTSDPLPSNPSSEYLQWIQPHCFAESKGKNDQWPNATSSPICLRPKFSIGNGWNYAWPIKMRTKSLQLNVNQQLWSWPTSPKM